MANNVFAEGMGFFHKGSGGKGVAPGDVCLSPPPPPTGPAPVPYVNTLFAKDLTKGSKSVKIQGNPTALENKSEVATSTGDEPGTQGGGVITHKTKGKGAFLLWSFNVKAEGKGVCCHGDPMGQNCGSDPLNAGDAAAQVDMQPKPPEDKNGTLRVTATNPSESERAAAEHMTNLGHNVELRDPVGTRASGGTSDLLVDGVPYDVYTPSSANPNRIISAIAKKNDQATGIIVDLSNSQVTREQLGNVLARVNGAGATNITDVIIIGK